jgi:uncharacterized membrane protein YfcA
MLFILFILVGAITGVLAGLLGIGGGVITVPALYYILSYYGFPQGQIMHTAIATALASTVLTSLGSTWSHQKKQAILFPALKWIVPGLVAGCFLGAVLSYYLTSEMLETIFGAMAILFALYFFFPKLPPLHIASRINKSLALFGVAVGALSTLLGVGGGIFMVPILIGYQVPMRNVVATSSAGTLATAFIGSLLYLAMTWDKATLPQSIGYIQVPAFLMIGIFSFSTTSLGVRLAHVLPASLIKRIFAIALAATGLAMLLGR